MIRALAKKIVPVFMVFILLLLVGCESNSVLSPAEITEKIICENTFSEMGSLSGDKLSSYFQFSDTDVKRFSVLISTSTDSADTVAAFEVDDQEKQTLVISGISQYVTKLSSAMKSSMESEYNKVQSRLLMKNKNTIILVICSEPENVQNQLEQIGAKAVY